MTRSNPKKTGNMKPRAFALFLVYTFFLQALSVSAQQVISEISTHTASPDEPFTVVFTLRNLTTKKLYVPDFGPLDLRSGPSQSTSNSNINGVITTEWSFIYTLSGHRAGTYTIPAAYAIEKGKKIYSKPLQITISGKRKPGQAPPAEPQKEDRDVRAPEMYLVVESSHEKVYLGQPLEISYCLYANGVGIYSFFNENLPQPENALVKLKKEMNEKKFETGTYRGKRMQKLVLLKFIVQPVTVGTLRVPAPSLGVQFEKEQQNREQPGGMQDLMNMFFGSFMDEDRPIRQRLRGNALSVPVLSLPGTGIPEGFKGAIGEYSVSASMPDLDVKAGKSIAYTIKVKGKGNINLLSELPLKLPAGWEVFGPQVQRNVDDSTTIPAGEIDFVYSLIPQQEGKTYIPPQRFVYFNPDKGIYEIAKTDSIAVNVLPGDRLNAVEAPRNDAEAPAVRSLPGMSWFTLLWAAIGLLLTVVLAAVVLEWRKRRRHKITGTGRAEFRQKLVALQQLPEQEIYRELEKWLVSWARERMGIDDVYTSTNLEQRFREQGLDETRTQLWLSTWKACNDARYAPAMAGDARNWIEKAKQLSDY